MKRRHLLVPENLRNRLQGIARPGGSLENRAPVARLAGARFELKNAADAADLYIYGDIAWYDITAAMVAQQLSQVTAPVIRVHINSCGGDIFDGVAIYNLLAQNPARIEVTIDGLAASIASVIAMAGDEIAIAKNAMMMIHRAWGFAMGDADDMRAMATLLEGTENDMIIPCYADRTGMASADLAALMAAETWMNAQACVDRKFADRILDGAGPQALLRPGLYAHAPAELLASGDWKCAAAMDLEIDETDSWDGSAAAERILDAAGFNGASPDSTKARPYFFAYDSGDPTKKESYKLPFADFVGGKIKAIEGGLRAVASRLPLTDIPDTLKTEIRTKLDQYFKRRDDEKASANRVQIMRMRVRALETSL